MLIMAKYIQKRFKPPVIVGFGNPLLDICAKPPPKDIFEKYKLILDGQIELKAEEYIAFFKDITSVIKAGLQWPGGSALNTLRLFQWIVGSPGYTVMFGAVGGDDNGRFLEEYVSKAGVITRFIHHKEYHTGTCLTFVQGEVRSLVAHIGAANFCAIDVDLPDIREMLKIAPLVYIEGFFLTHGFKLIEKILQICHENETFCALNLSAPYVCENFTKELAVTVQNSDIICGNACEFKSFCKAMNWTVETSVDAAIAIQKHCQNHNRNPSPKKLRKKTIPNLLQNSPFIIITDGRNDVIVAEGLSNAPVKYPVPILPKCMIKDTTGAGDAFIAGFLAGAFCDLSMNASIEWGCKTASTVIRTVGVDTPCDPPSWIQDSN